MNSTCFLSKLTTVDSDASSCNLQFSRVLQSMLGVTKILKNYGETPWMPLLELPVSVYFDQGVHIKGGGHFQGSRP
jgi:hypothetical protein